MKNVFRNPVVIALISFVLGAGALFGIQRLRARTLLTKESHAAPAPRQAANSLLTPQPQASTGSRNAAANAPQNLDSALNQFFNDSFFGNTRDPFAQMRRMRQLMAQSFQNMQNAQGAFDTWYQNRFGGNAGEVTRREDSHYVYYDVAIQGLKKDKVKVSVRNGQIAISGQTENKSHQGDTGTYFVSSFHRSFPVPQGVDANRVQIVPAKNKLIIKFPKIT